MITRLLDQCVDSSFGLTKDELLIPGQFRGNKDSKSCGKSACLIKAEQVFH